MKEENKYRAFPKDKILINNSPQLIKREKTRVKKQLPNKPADTFNLKEKKMELYREMCAILPDFKWGLLWEKLFEIDEEFIRRLKEYVFSFKTESPRQQIAFIDKLSGGLK